MIELKNIRKIYDKGTKRSVDALKGISLVLPDKGMVFIVGRSGGGKSTLLNVLGGLDTYDEGDFLIDGVSTKDFSDANWDSYRNHYIGFVFQDHRLMPNYNVRENIEFALALQNEKEYKSKINEVLKTVDLDGFNERYTQKLSGGQRQRVSIARALVKESHMILADEPTGNLDASTAREIFTLLKKISKTKLVIVVTHDVNAANLYADMAVQINNGLIGDAAITPAFMEESNICSTRIGSEIVIGLIATPKDNLIELDSKIVSSNLPIEKPSDISTHQYIKKNLNLEKSTLSRKAIFKVIKKTLKKRIVRFSFSVVFCMLTLVLLMSSFKMLTWQPQAAQERAIALENVSAIGRIEYREVYIDGKLEYSKSPIQFSQDDLAEIRTEFPYSPIYEIKGTTIKIQSLGKELNGMQNSFYVNKQNGFCFINEQGLKDFDYSLLAGEYPNSSWANNDIIITKYNYEMFALCGYKDINGSIMKINSYNDMIGKTIELRSHLENHVRFFTIKGIVDTNFHQYDSLRNYALNPKPKGGPSKLHQDLFNGYISSLWNINPHNMIYVNIDSSYAVDIGTYFVIQKNVASENKAKVQFLLGNDRYEFSDHYSSLIRGTDSIKTSTVLPIFYIVMAVLFTFAAFLLINFIVCCINETTNEIGILRCVGTSKKDIFKIYLFEAIFFTSIIYILSIIVFSTLCVPYVVSVFLLQTLYLPFSLFVVDIFDFLFLAGVIIALVTISLSLTTLRLINKSPNQILVEM